MTRPSAGGMEIAPFRALRFNLDLVKSNGGDPAKAVTSPPYDVISPEEHRKFLELSPHNITRITLGLEPGGASDYSARASLLSDWVNEGILLADEDPCFYVYSIDYAVPGTGKEGAAPRRAHFLGLLALGRLHAFADGIVLPHEQTFPKVVEDRYRLLEATRTNLESIFLLYSDASGEVDRILARSARSKPVIRVEAKPGEFHALHRIGDVADYVKLIDRFRLERPIIADGHHRYTTSLRFALAQRGLARPLPGSDWQLITFANLHGEGLSILATHRLVRLAVGAGEDRERAVSKAVELLLSRLEAASGDQHDFEIETRTGRYGVRFPQELVSARRGVAATAYSLLHDVVLGDWLAPQLDSGIGIRYFKDGTGEAEALAGGDGDLLFRMRPVDRAEFRSVVEGGEVFPHKTTYFYPKLWSGLALWPIEEPGRLELK